MSREEDLIRSTTRAIAATVREVPPLRLSTATDEPRRIGRHAREPRRPRGWLVPAAAAAAVLAIALSLVLIRDIPNGRVAPPTRPVPAVDGVPAYYAGLAKTSDAETSPEQIVVGQTVTGKRLATLAPPAGTTFAGITGAADDRTFVVDTQPGSLDPESEPWQPRTWYLLRIDPGSAHPARLTPLPIPGTAAGTNVMGIALSPDGTELAVGLQPDGLNDPGAPTYLRVYSVASGAALHRGSRPLPRMALVSRSSSPGPNTPARTATSRSPGWVSAGWRSATAGSYRARPTTDPRSRRRR